MFLRIGSDSLRAKKIRASEFPFWFWPYLARPGAGTQLAVLQILLSNFTREPELGGRLIEVLLKQTAEMRRGGKPGALGDFI